MRVLVFRIGSLGDTLVSLPAMWRARTEFPAAEFVLMCDQHPGKQYVLASDLLRGAGIFDAFMTYPVLTGSRVARAWETARLAMTLRRRRFDVLVYLAPSRRQPHQVARDRRFFKLCGIRRIIGIDGPFYDLDRPPERPMQTLPSEADLLMERLTRSGLDVGPKEGWRFDLALNANDEAVVDQWVQQNPQVAPARWVGVGPGSKMPAKIWPKERYGEVLRQLFREYGLVPVIFGGGEDVDAGNWIVDYVGHGAVAAGQLGLRASAAGLGRCELYLGNDTGTMHLAASAGTPCVALFSARSYPGLWYPNGPSHTVLRRQVTCEGCELVTCDIEKTRCLTEIGVSEVVNACRDTLSRLNSQ